MDLSNSALGSSLPLARYLEAKREVESSARKSQELEEAKDGLLSLEKAPLLEKEKRKSVSYQVRSRPFLQGGSNEYSGVRCWCPG